MGISSQCSFPMGKQWERHTTRLDVLGALWLARWRLCAVSWLDFTYHTGRLQRDDFGFEFWRYQRASASARTRWRWRQLSHNWHQVWMLLDDFTCTKTRQAYCCGQVRYGDTGIVAV